MSRDYWLGVLTTPLAAVVLVALVVAFVRVTDWLERHGITFAVHWSRNTDISDYLLRHNIWWERSFGPVFSGGWYRVERVYNAPSHARFNRWVGIGRADGPNVIVFHSRDLGEVAETNVR